MPIPKIIHYCWLSDEPMTIFARQCIARWRKMLPDFELKKWDKSAFDINSVAWVRDAYAHGKYAFAADYIRAYALYTCGGVYFDCDIVLRQNGLSQMLDNEFFSFIEAYYTDGVRTTDIQIQAAAMGAVAGHPFLADVLRYYESQQFVYDAKRDLPTIMPIVLAEQMKPYGLQNDDAEQQLQSGIHIYPSTMLAPNTRSETSAAIAVHACEHSWRNKNILSDSSRHIRSFVRGLKLLFS